ncbi:MAG TPA: Mpo1-like protein [Opitutus sp.]|nr:Mpo1-like protein [Opitutus sp.]
MLPERKSADQWFAEHALVHVEDRREIVHWICVPLMFLGVFGLLWSIPVPAFIAGGMPGFRWSLPALAFALMFYARISMPLAVGVFVFILLCQLAVHQIALGVPWPVWEVCAALFVAGWIGELVCRVIDRRIPSLGRDLAFILIGPAWLMSKLYRRFGLKY